MSTRTDTPASVLATAYADLRNSLTAFSWALAASELPDGLKRAYDRHYDEAVTAFSHLECAESDYTSCTQLATVMVGRVAFCADCAPRFFVCDACQLTCPIAEQTIAETGRRVSVLCRACAAPE